MARDIIKQFAASNYFPTSELIIIPRNRLKGFYSRLEASQGSSVISN